MADGLLIALEGIDGSGTSTQMAPLAEHLRALGRTVCLTAEPSGGEIGRLLRRALHGTPAVSDAALALLFAADRLHHISCEIEPMIEQGALVITDRYLRSSYAYQASTLPLAWVQSINAQARLPDLSVYFRVSPDVAAQRRAARGLPADHFETDVQQARIAARYEQLLDDTSAGPVHIIDAEQSVADVTRQLCAALDAHLASRK